MSEYVNGVSFLYGNKQPSFTVTLTLFCNCLQNNLFDLWLIKVNRLKRR